MARFTTTRRTTAALLIAVLLLLGGGAYALAGAASSPTPTPGKSAKSSAQGEDEGVHGGPKARIHAGCTLASGLTGNWTHGDYVSAVEKKYPGNAEKIREAAKSDCGKVDHAAARAARAKAKAARAKAKG